jgi:hypothetical protein
LPLRQAFRNLERKEVDQSRACYGGLKFKAVKYFRREVGMESLVLRLSVGRIFLSDRTQKWLMVKSLLPSQIVAFIPPLPNPISIPLIPLRLPVLLASLTLMTLVGMATIAMVVVALRSSKLSGDSSEGSARYDSDPVANSVGALKSA